MEPVAVKNEGTSDVARNLRLMADAIDKGVLQGIAVATLGTCPDPSCGEQHAGAMYWIEDIELPSANALAMIAAVNLLGERAVERYKEGVSNKTYGALKSVDPDGK